VGGQDGHRAGWERLMFCSHPFGHFLHDGIPNLDQVTFRGIPTVKDFFQGLKRGQLSLCRGIHGVGGAFNLCVGGQIIDVQM